LPQGEAPIKKINWRSIFAGFSPPFVLAHFFNHLVTALPVPLLPWIRDEFGLTNTQAGLVISAYTLSMGLAQLPSGLLADRIGPHKIITISILGIGLSGVLIGITHNYYLMLAFLVLMGIAGGGYHPSAPPLLAASVPRNNLGKAFGFHLVGGNAAFFVAPLIGAGIAALWGWRAGFIGLAVPTLLFGIVFYFLISRMIIRKNAEVAEEHKNDAPEKEVPHDRSWLRRIVLFLTLTALVSSLSTSMMSFLSLFAVDRFGISAAAAAVFVAINNSTGLWASPLGGYVSDRMGHIPSLLISCVAAAPIIFLMTITPYGIWFVVVLLAWGALNSIRMPTTESFIIHNISAKRRSTLLGVYYFASQHGSGILAPVLGFMIDHYGYSVGFNFVAVASLGVTLILGFFLWQAAPRTSSPSTT
jgi:MFS transporter, FSR family, fosmidomycin resistance protein